MKLMGLEAMYPRPKVKTSIPGYEKFPYLLTDLEIKKLRIKSGAQILPIFL